MSEGRSVFGGGEGRSRDLRSGIGSVCVCGDNRRTGEGPQSAPQRLGGSNSPFLHPGGSACTIYALYVYT